MPTKCCVPPCHVPVSCIIPSGDVNLIHYRAGLGGTPDAISAWYAAEDIAAPVARGANVMMLVQLYNSSPSATMWFTGCKLQWQVSGGSWASIDADSSNAIWLRDLINGADNLELPDPQLTTGGRTMYTGEYYDTSLDMSPGSALPSGGIQEFCFGVSVGSSAVAGATYEFRIVDATEVYAVDLDVTPSLVVSAARRGNVMIF